MRPVLALAALALLSSCIPSRNNPYDPSNAPRPEIEIRVDSGAGEVLTAAGSRGARWILDGSGSRGPGGSGLGSACFDWRISAVGAAEPSLVSEGDWVPVLEPEERCDEAAAMVQSTSGSVLFAQLTGVDDFEATGVGSTTTATRWIRLTLKVSGVRATEFREITVVNEPPFVTLGPDRRTAPGGRWWLANEADRPFENVVVAQTSDPDPVLAVRWRVNGELATRLDSSPADGYVDDVYTSVVNSAHQVTLPMSIHPSKSELFVEAFDVVDDDGAPTGLPGTDSARMDVVSTMWVYSAGTGFLSYLDTTQFLSPWDQLARAVAVSPTGEILAAEPFDASTVSITRRNRGLERERSQLNGGPTDPIAETNVAYVAAADDGEGGWWVQAGGAGCLYHFDPIMDVDRVYCDVTLTSGFQREDFYAGLGGFRPQVVAAPGKTAWVAGGELGSGTRGRFLMRMGYTSGIPVTAPIQMFGSDEIGHLEPDGAGGVWVASFDRDISHVSLAGVRTDYTVPAACPGQISSMTVDTARQAMWLGMGASPNVICRIPTADFSIVSVKTIGSPGDVIVDPLDGSALMIAGPSIDPGIGISRYRFPSADGGIASVEFIPMRLGIYANEILRVDGSLLLNVTQSAPNFQTPMMLMVEAADIYQPNNIELEIDPYVFSLARHVVDPVTGFAWVYRPDDAIVASYAPDGTKMFEADVPLPDNKRAHLAFDPDARRMWVMSSDLWTGDPFPLADDRLYTFEVPVSQTGTAVASTAGTHQIAMARGIAVVPSSNPVSGGSVCLAANFDTETLFTGPVRNVSSGGVSGTPYVLNDAGQDELVWAAADPVSGECWFGIEGFDDEIPRLMPGQGASVTNHAGRSLLQPGFIAADKAIAYSPNQGSMLSIIEPADVRDPLDGSAQMDSFHPTLDENAFTVVATDPYYRHVWLGQSVGGDIVRFSTGETPREMWRDGGFNNPRIENGR